MDIVDGEYLTGVFLRGLKFSDKNLRGLKFLGENLRDLKSISKFDQFFFQNFHFLEDTDPNIWRSGIFLKNPCINLII